MTGVQIDDRPTDRAPWKGTFCTNWFLPNILHLSMAETLDDDSKLIKNCSIIAVHGLNVWGTADHGNRCWTDNETGTNWLSDLLPTRLPQARVLVFHYNSNVIRNVATTGVEEHALNLLNALWLKREVDP